MPSLPSTTKPEPSEDTLRSAGDLPPLRLKKSSKNSSNGAPFGTRGNGTPSGPFTVWLVEMLTTASISFSASGATLVGPWCVCEPAGASISSNAAAPRPARRPSHRLALPPLRRPACGLFGGRLGMQGPAHGQVS